MPDRRFRLLALDVDGTLLDHRGDLTPRTAAAVARAARAGVRPVLCTGRRYRRARPIAEALGLDAPLVCNSGAIVKEPSDGRTLWRADFAPDLLAACLDLFKTHRQDAVGFTDRGPTEPDFLVAAYPTGRPLFDDYVGQNRPHAQIDPRWLERARAEGEPHYHVCAIGDRRAMLDFEAAICATLPGRVRTFVQKSPRYAGTMCELLHPEASKWSAVLHLAARWGIAPEEICAVGDDQNDVPMLLGAGLGVAMGHAPPEVLAAADLVTGDHENEGLARLIEDVLLG